MRHQQRATGRTHGDYGDDNRPLALNSISGLVSAPPLRSVNLHRELEKRFPRTSDSAELAGTCDISSASTWSDVQEFATNSISEMEISGGSVDELSARVEKIRLRVILCSLDMGLTLSPFQKGSAFLLVFFVSLVTPPHR